MRTPIFGSKYGNSVPDVRTSRVVSVLLSLTPTVNQQHHGPSYRLSGAYTLLSEGTVATACLLFHHLYAVALSGVLHRILHFGWWARLNESSPMERANSTTPSHCCILSIFRPAESLSDYKLDVAHQLLVYQVGYYCGRPYWCLRVGVWSPTTTGQPKWRLD